MRDAGNSDDPHPTRGPSATQPVQSDSSSYWFQFIVVPVQSDSSFIRVQSDSSLNHELSAVHYVLIRLSVLVLSEEDSVHTDAIHTGSSSDGWAPARRRHLCGMREILTTHTRREDRLRRNQFSLIPVQFILVPVQSDFSFIPVQSDSSLSQFTLG